MKWVSRCILITIFTIMSVTLCFSGDTPLANKYRINKKLSALLIKEGIRFDLSNDAAIEYYQCPNRKIGIRTQDECNSAFTYDIYEGDLTKSGYAYLDLNEESGKIVSVTKRKIPDYAINGGEAERQFTAKYGKGYVIATLHANPNQGPGVYYYIKHENRYLTFYMYAGSNQVVYKISDNTDCVLRDLQARKASKKLF